MLKGFKRLFAFPAALGLVHSSLAEEQGAERWGVNMRQGVTEVAQSTYDLHMLIFWICVAIGVLVFGVMFYSMWRHRKSRGYKAAQFHESTIVELVWTIIPTLILIGMAVPATKTLYDIYDTEEADIDIMVTGYQWKWKYDYLGSDVSFFSNLSTPRTQIDNRQPKSEHYLLEVDEPLVIPVNKKVRFLLTANDVIHSWWVPELAVKKDAIPGFINEAWARVDEPGIYRGQCAELCGKDHGFMPIVVKAVPEAEYNAWLSERAEAAAKMKALTEKTFTFDELFARGEQVYNRTCAACHQPNGQGVPGAFPAIAGSKIATGPLEGHLNIVIYGSKVNPAMQAFGQQLSEVDLAAVITYQRNAFGNDMGDTVQPVDILNFKNQQ
ncbi:cytochrome c oxidase subunit II [Microbulbifer thermotolerans]|uniref:Cytochrome c oxidase subunit 2 n=1 Tax=Microbulbifer thermotolerans TaxID=252514 RepID=A0AB35HWI5_MICTH|nr:cytochrome c oxidase subunit II [Microbulbifer thermotolerans]MCX2778471.1 cytochrome c oxidase subunit II [Microbulbifer thermotolerans]MCX2783942.1 cytochrome c oxidase subunit II [Microbulbifer thermotolerans]MCX2793955.1 cytochrome c oxidase subunit II [Microbulbifer thermotolerans]MCX2801659.1 cytochrome c oxidase subunit II [Microbulbifer thermotolerans]MCX2804020.1 cytochrome c oxidase subunit II [Microbulbifer thermotolerans]